MLDQWQPASAGGASQPESLVRASLKARDERLDAMKSFIAHLAHDLNNSLSPLTGYISLLGDYLGARGPGSQYLIKFDNSMRKTEEFIRTLVQATHPEREFILSSTDLSQVLRETLESWRKSTPPRLKIDVVTDIAPECILELDESHWRKAILHLLSNAELAMPNGGTVHVILQPCTLSNSEAAELGLEARECLYLAIEDTGCGLSEEVLLRGFDPLFTTHPHGPGSGLGLPLVHAVVRLHGGQVTMENIEGSGAAVRIWLPISAAKTPEPKGSPQG